MLVFIFSWAFALLAVASVVLKVSLMTLMFRRIDCNIVQVDDEWHSCRLGLILFPASVVMELGVAYLLCHFGWLYWWVFTVDVVVVIINCFVNAICAFFLNRLRA